MLKFKAAVAAGDKGAVASMAQFPLLFVEDELDKPGFIRQFEAIFDKRVRRRLLSARPVKDGRFYEVNCGPGAIFEFEKIDGEYRFIGIGGSE